VNAATLVSRNPRVVARELPPPDGAVLLHLETGAYHGLNPVGFLVWTAIEQERPLGEVVEAVRSRVRNAPPQLPDDVARFVASAVERDLVVVREPADGEG
jgi:hypothetical protein